MQLMISVTAIMNLVGGRGVRGHISTIPSPMSSQKHFVRHLVYHHHCGTSQ